MGTTEITSFPLPYTDEDLSFRHAIMQAPLLKCPTDWVLPAMESTLCRLSGHPHPAFAIAALLAHYRQNPSLYERPPTLAEDGEMQRCYGVAHLAHAPAIDTPTILALLSDGDEWRALDDYEMAAAADADAILILQSALASDSHDASSILDAAGRAVEVVEAICARAIIQRAAESCFSRTAKTAFMAAAVVEAAGAAIAQRCRISLEVGTHVLFARLYRQRFAHVKGFIQPYTAAFPRLKSAAEFRAQSMFGGDVVEQLCTYISRRHVSDALATSILLYLSEGADDISNGAASSIGA